MKHESLPAHFFAADGQLFDTRREDWANRPIRTVYAGVTDARNIQTGVELRAALRIGSHTLIGGNPLAFHTLDGGTLCPHCVKANLYECLSDIRTGADTGWRVFAVEALCPDQMLDDDAPDGYPGTPCDHCGDIIE